MTLLSFSLLDFSLLAMACIVMAFIFIGVNALGYHRGYHADDELFAQVCSERDEALHRVDAVAALETETHKRLIHLRQSVAAAVVDLREASEAKKLATIRQEIAAVVLRLSDAGQFEAKKETSGEEAA